MGVGHPTSSNSLALNNGKVFKSEYWFKEIFFSPGNQRGRIAVHHLPSMYYVHTLWQQRHHHFPSIILFNNVRHY